MSLLLKNFLTIFLIIMPARYSFGMNEEAKKFIEELSETLSKIDFESMPVEIRENFRVQTINAVKIFDFYNNPPTQAKDTEEQECQAQNAILKKWRRHGRFCPECLSNAIFFKAKHGRIKTKIKHMKEEHKLEAEEDNNGNILYFLPLQ